jgi:hypothetical protein
MPGRIQLKRTRGWRIPPNTVKVDRSTRWGNPFPVEDFMMTGDIERHAAARRAVDHYERWLRRDPAVRGVADPPSTETIQATLGGKNLACWCKPDDACHADVLLRVANASHEPATD